MKLFSKLWADEAGFVISAELVLVATILVIGMIVGLVVIRNQVVQELVDVGEAIGAMSQTYAFGGIYKPDCALTDGSYWSDQKDFCQSGNPGNPNAETSGKTAGAVQIQVIPGPVSVPQDKEI